MKELFMDIGQVIKSDCGLYTLERVETGWIYRYAPDFKREVFIPTGHHVHELILAEMRRTGLREGELKERKPEHKPIDTSQFHTKLDRIRAEIMRIENKLPKF